MNKVSVVLLVLSISLVTTIALVIKLMIENKYMKKSIISITENLGIITENLGIIFSVLIKLKDDNTTIEESLKEVVDIMVSAREKDAAQIEIIKTVVEKINKLEDPFRNSNKEEKEEIFN